MALWFRTAVLTGILAFLVGPRGGLWLEPEIAALQTDGKGSMSMHHYCHLKGTYTPESGLASDGMFFMLSNKTVEGHSCKCPPNTTHHKDYADILGKSHKAERRLRVHTNLTEKLILHTQSLWKPLAAEPLFPTVNASGTGPVSGSGPRGPVGKEEPEPIQVFPTESAVRAKEKKKADKLAGIKPKRKPVHVEDHHDDLGDDMSGLGDVLSYLAADVAEPSWTDEDTDEEAEALVSH